MAVFYRNMTFYKVDYFVAASVPSTVHNLVVTCHLAETSIQSRNIYARHTN
jgi:hypothetical protein